MNAWRRWANQPQSLWIRKAFFYIHLWTGIGIGLYIVLISVSGSAIVYRREMAAKAARPPVIVVESGPRLSQQELEQDVQRLYPDYRLDVSIPTRTDHPASVVLERDNKRIVRLFDPYTGMDLGDPITDGVRVIEWLVDLHINLLMGERGRLLNGIGSIFVTLLSLTGAVLWWPGRKDWRRSLTVQWGAKFPRVTWDLHSAMGFWCYIYILLWGISGIYFSFPRPFEFLAGYFFPVQPSSGQLPLGDQVLYWLSRLHFGRFGWQLEALWTVLGLVPAAMFVTGALMWWNRSLRKSRDSEPSRNEHAAAIAPEKQLT